MFAKGVCCQKAQKCQDMCTSNKSVLEIKTFLFFNWALAGPNLDRFICIIFAGLLMELQDGIVEIVKKQKN